jgi:hypothetical protein
VQAVGLDPVLATVKLIAEPRGVGQEGLVKGAAMQQVDLEVAFQTAEHQHHGVLHHSTLLALEAEVIAALDAAVAAFDRAVQLLNYPAGAVSPTPGVDGAFCTELSHRTLAMLGSAHPDDLRRAAALLHVTACVKRVVAHCARLAGLAPMLAPLLSGDPGIRRTSELEVLATRHRLVLARDAVGVIAASPGAASVRTPAAPQSQAGGQSCTILALAAAGRAGRPSLAAGDSALARLAELLDQINLEAGYIDEEATSVTVGLFIEMA